MPGLPFAKSNLGLAELASRYSDQYVDRHEIELGAQWKNRDLWLEVSYPFFQADKIRTPTLFMGGGSDVNVPIIGSEQMYQALKSNGVDTQLVIYPGDRLERYLAWYSEYLGAASTAADDRIVTVIESESGNKRRCAASTQY